MEVRRGLVWSLLLLEVVVNCQNNPPNIPLDLPDYFSLNENTAIGTEIFILRAVDQDSTDILTFRTLTQDTTYLVRLGPTGFNSSLQQWTCSVILNSSLDRDNSPSSRQLYFGLNDGRLTISVRILMLIDDVNDNPPRFVGLPYRTSIREDLQTGSLVFKVSATDADTISGSIVFNMKSVIVDDNQTFLLGMSGSITLNKSLDYERQSFYHYNVSAKDQGNPPCPGDTCQCQGPAEICNPEPVDIFITIIDVQDTPPVFEKIPYIGKVAENETVGYSILQVTAMDGDRGVSQPNMITFSFTEGDFSPFAIHETDGTISVGTKLDADDDNVRDKGGVYVFTVTATEMSQSQDGSVATSNPNNKTSTQVSITVSDVNDNPPEFNENRFTATVLENTPSGVPITTTSSIEVFDKDQGSNSRFWVHLEKDGQPYLDFDTLPKQNSVIPGRSTITIRVINSSVLDYETTKTITFKIIAQENNTDPNISRSSETTVILEIEDTNDNSPYFPSQPTTFNVSEDVYIGHVIANVTARDDDSGDFGQITFSIEADGLNGEFNITDWGQIQVAKPLDREQRKLYSLAVVATDSPSASPNQRRKSTLRVEVSITDVNDHAPVWTQYIPMISILESTKSGTKIADLKAIDLDDGDNARIAYFISPGTNGSDLFNITTINGAAEITVGQSLVDHFGLRSVKVVAVDMGTPPLNNSVELSIIVIDENQNRPVFIEPDQNKSVPEIMVEEEQPVGTILYTLLATDKDIDMNGLVEYYLNPTTIKDYEYFTIARVSGILQSVRRLDRETKETYEIQVRAEDNGQPAPLSTLLTMRIKLTDINDNQPSFRDVQMPQVLHVIEEKSSAYIGQIKPAVDPDSYPHNQSCYYLYGNGTSGLYLEKVNGSFFVTDKVDREQTSSLNAIIKASENCNLPNDFYMSVNNISAASSSNSIKRAPDGYNSLDDSLLWVEVVIDDINDNAPTFLSHSFSASAIFDVDIGTEVLSLATSVTDKDTQINSKNMFKLVAIMQELETAESPDTFKAFIMSVNGSITTNIRFQSDLLGYFLLRVMVYDNDGMNDSAIVKVYMISNLQRVKLVFNKLVNQVEELKDSFLKQLSDILNLDLLIDKIQSHTKSDGTRDPNRTDAYMHGRYRDTGKIVPATDLWQMLDYSHDARALLYSNGVVEAKPLTEEKTDNETEELKRIFAILISVLGIIVIALLLVLIHLVRLYRRRLKAATMAYSSPKEKELIEHPGTNKYFTAKNPLFGNDIKDATIDEDKTSHNSLDLNEVGQPYSTFQTSKHEDQIEEQEMVLQIADLNVPPTKDTNHSSHLDEVLQAYSNEAYEDDGDAYDPYGRISNVQFVGEDMQEGVTRFSDESGLPDTDIRRHLNHTDI